MATLLRMLTSEERSLAESFPAQGRRRQFVLGRLAARRAIRSAVGPTLGEPSIEVLAGSRGEPVAHVDEAPDRILVSVSHSGPLAAACAWHVEQDLDYSAGVDLERLRPTRLADNRYAFSRRERALLARIPASGRALAALAAWTVKEAAWKALRLGPAEGPEAVEVESLDISTGRAGIRGGRAAVPPSMARAVRGWIRRIGGKDGPYLLAVAEVGASDALASRGGE